MDNQTDKKNLVIYRKSDRLLVAFIKFDHAHIKQLAASPEYETVITNEEELFYSFQGRAYVGEVIKDAIPLKDILKE